MSTLGYKRKFGVFKVHRLAQALQDADDFEAVTTAGQGWTFLLDAVREFGQFNVEGLGKSTCWIQTSPARTMRRCWA